ncbi:MAD2L1-binding protein [Calypte anna]|nr:MAD2L1-binding protein [Calypte anna]
MPTDSPAGLRPGRAAGRKPLSTLPNMAPAPPEAGRGGLSVPPMLPCGGGHSNPSPPLIAGQKMAAPGIAVVPGAAPPGSPTPPLLIAEAPPILDCGGRMTPQRSGTTAASPSVSVVFPGTVTRESCCRFVCELLKHILHQRHQLPLPYEQLAFFCRRPPQDGDEMKKPHSMDLASKKCQQALMDLERVLHHLEVMFHLTPVPRVLILLGGNVMNPKEFYELSFEGVCEGSAEESLKTASCVRKLFHSLFIADVFSELKALPVMDTIVMIQGHRDCGVDWFHPKLNYKVPARGRKLTVNLSCGGDINLSASPSQPMDMDSTWEDYIWFQAPVTIKGFRE